MDVASKIEVPKRKKRKRRKPVSITSTGKNLAMIGAAGIGGALTSRAFDWTATAIETGVSKAAEKITEKRLQQPNQNSWEKAAKNVK